MHGQDRTRGQRARRRRQARAKRVGGEGEGLVSCTHAKALRVRESHSR